MKHIAPVVFAFLLIATLPGTHAQDMQGPSWEMGWVTDVDPKYTVDLEDDWDLTGSLVVYVSNEGPATLNLALTYDYDEDGPFELDGPETVEVAGNANDTFTITITGAEADVVRAFSPSSSVELVVVGEEKVGDSSLRTRRLKRTSRCPECTGWCPMLWNPPTSCLPARGLTFPSKSATSETLRMPSPWARQPYGAARTSPSQAWNNSKTPWCK
mgnify:CR=1 FL=1